MFQDSIFAPKTHLLGCDIEALVVVAGLELDIRLPKKTAMEA
jgi:hypothetical protein